MQRGGSHSRVAKLQPHEYFVGYVRECLTWCADPTGRPTCLLRGLRRRQCILQRLWNVLFWGKACRTHG